MKKGKLGHLNHVVRAAARVYERMAWHPRKCSNPESLRRISHYTGNINAVKLCCDDAGLAFNVNAVK